MRVKKWENFQHYKNRRPPWIRLYRDLLDDPEFHALSGDAAKYLIMIWLIASEDPGMAGDLPNLPKLAFRLRIKNSELDRIIKELSHWIEYDASAMLADSSQGAIPEGDQSRGRVRGRSESDLDAGVKPRAPQKRKTAKSTPTWEAYSLAYTERYGAGPVRNSKANALCCQLVDRLGTEEAPKVAAFYLRSQNRWYSTKGHAIGPLVADAEKLRTEWATGNQLTETAAREADRLQTAGNVWRDLADEAREKQAGKADGGL